MINLKNNIKRILPSELHALLSTAGKISAGRKETVYLVGGVVRDLLLEQSGTDLDLVVEGNAITLARQLAKAINGYAKTHPHFGTAKIALEHISIDLVTARSESYSRPGALPTVKPDSIESDLQRRDFSINAMAVVLNPKRFGDLIDFHEGLNDLKQGLIRILHPDSFTDDATRILRAMRYEQRLNFRLEQSTKAALSRDLPMLDTISSDRLRHELELILNEDYPERILQRAHELEVLDKLRLPLRDTSRLTAIFTMARRLMDKPGFDTYTALLAYGFNKDETDSFISRFNMPRKSIQIIRNVIDIKQDINKLAQQDISPSAICHLLKNSSPDAIQAVIIATGFKIARQHLQLYLDDLRYIKPFLNGEDLISMGVPAGRRLGQTLRYLKNARLDRKVKSREEEKVLAQQMIDKHVPS